MKDLLPLLPQAAPVLAALAGALALIPLLRIVGAILDDSHEARAAAELHRLTAPPRRGGRHRPGMVSGTVTQTIRDDPTMPIDAATLQGAVR